MTWVGRRHVGNGPEVVFNECLAVGYFEGGKMGVYPDQ